MRVATLSNPLEAIVPDTRREGSVRLVAEGRTLLSVPAEVAAEEGLRVGLVLEQDQLDRLAAAADRAATYRTALALLGRRAFARRELGRRLLLKGHSPELVEAALTKAEAAGYLDDAKFAVQFVEARSARGQGPARIRQELSARGVAPQFVDRALQSESVSGPAVSARIAALIAKRKKQLGGLSGASLKRRIVAYLARRGYTGAEVLRLVREGLS